MGKAFCIFRELGVAKQVELQINLEVDLKVNLGLILKRINITFHAQSADIYDTEKDFCK